MSPGSWLTSRWLRTEVSSPRCLGISGSGRGANMASVTVLSFMSNFSNRDTKSPPSSSPTTQQLPAFPEKQNQDGYRPATPQRAQQQPSNIRESPQRRENVQGNRVSSRPLSMVQTYQPPLMELSHDTLPELQPIFTYLNSHGNKLYQEGYFLKLDDQNTRM